MNNDNKNTKDIISEEISWNFKSEKGEIKCREDEENQLNVLLINDFYLENVGEPTINKCANLFYSNDYRIVIITEYLWVAENTNPYHYAQVLFPKIDIKYYMAMKQTDYNKKLFEADKSQFVNANTCLIYNSWEELLESEPDNYGEDVTHLRTKIFNPIRSSLINEAHEVRKRLQITGHNKTSTDILIFTDYINFGSASNFIKTIQSNGAGIVASYGGNPNIKDEDKKYLDASLDPSFTTNYENTEEFEKLEDKGFDVFSIPYAEGFEKMTKNDYPMAFKVNQPDERTKIYHSYDDTYYNEFINEAKKIFEKYNNKSECNYNNKNLILEDSNCVFEDDEFAHGGHPCGTNGEWNTNVCNKSYCDIGYYYDKNEDKCLIDYCTNDPDTNIKSFKKCRR